MLRRSLLFVLFLLLAAALTAGADESRWQKNVRRTKDGCVYVDRIPQVSQKKNFCAPASVEMILRYYNNRISQRLLGRSFESSKKSGTFTNELLKEFEHGRLKDYSIKPLYRMTVKEQQALQNAYLQRAGSVPAAKSKKKSRGKSKNKKGQSGSGSVDFSTMNPQIAIPIFSRMRPHVKKIVAEEVMRNVDLGKPLLWAVQMNFDPHERTPGGHMRVIVGYQKSGGKIHSILYRDTWGKRENVKKMTLDQAAVMTMELFLIEPKKKSAAPAE